MLSADLIGFHTFDYARHFLSACKRVLELDYETRQGGVMAIKYSGRLVSISISHVGIDSAEMQRMACSKEVRERVAAIRSKYHPRKIIIGVDDLDLVKGSPLKLQVGDIFWDIWGF